MTAKAVRGAFRAGARALVHRNTLAVVVLGAGAGYVVHARRLSLAEAAFMAAITVLVFLLPAAAAVGPFLTRELKDAVEIVATAPEAQRDAARSDVARSMGTILDAAEPLHRAFAYCTLAVVLGAVGLVEPPVPGLGAWPAALASGLAIALLVGVALAVFPVTLRLLEFETVRAVYRRLFAIDEGKSTVDTTTGAAPVPVPAPVPTPPAPAAGGERSERTDQGALMGALLAVFVALVLGEGSWNLIGVIEGVTLLAVIAGYYRLPRGGWPTRPTDAVLKASALATVAALAACVALAYPLQEWWFRGRVCLDASGPGLEDCLGSQTTLHLWWVWVPIAIAITAGYLLLWRRRRRT
jgi:hypothetical protein